MTLGEIASWTAAVATLVGSAAVIITAIIYHRQLEAMTKARQMESLVVIMGYVQDLRLRKARYFMFDYGDQLRDLFKQPYSLAARQSIDKRVRELSANEVELHDIDLVINALNNVCFLLRHEYAPPEAVAFVENSFARAWSTFKPYADYRRSRTDIKEASQYAKQLELFVSELTHADNGSAKSRLRPMRRDAES